MDIPTAPHENEGPRILGATLTVTVLALITTIIRLYVRVKMIRNVGWDDYIMITAMCLCIAGQGVIIPEVQKGAGKHLPDIPFTDIPVALKLNFISQPIYLWAICVVKLSVGCFLLRIAVKPLYRRIIISVMVFMAVYTFACFLTIVLQCDNLAVQWDQTAKGKCWGPSTLKALSYTNNGFNITTDLLFAVIIPIPMLWNVQMNRKTKSSVIGVLALGVFATVAALVKLSYVPNYGKTGDWLWDSRNITIWTVIESNLGIVAGNLPCMKPLFTRILGSTYGIGSNKTPNPKYQAHPYGSGTGHHSVKKYSSLGSSRTDGLESNPYSPNQAHITSPIELDERHDGGTSRNSSRDNGQADRKGSQDSIIRLNGQPFQKMGGIIRTREVNVEESDDGMRPERKEAHLV